MSARPAGVVVLLAALLAAPAVGAQTREAREARALIEQGRALRRAGRDAEALAVFAQAYQRQPGPEAAGQIGFAEHALGRWAEAWTHLREALAAPDDPWVVAQRRALEFSLREVERRTGALVVECGAPGATLEVDGRAPVPLPLAAPLRLAAGAVALRTSAPGHRDDRREVTLQAGETARVIIQLAPVVALAPPAPPVVVAPPSAPAGEAPSSTPRVLGWLALGAATLAAGAAVAAFVVRDGAAERWNDDARCLGNGLTREQNCADDRDLVFTAQGLLVGSAVAGGALVIGAAILFATAPSSRPRAAPSVGLTVAPGGLGVTYGATF